MKARVGQLEGFIASASRTVDPLAEAQAAAAAAAGRRRGGRGTRYSLRRSCRKRRAAVRAFGGRRRALARARA